MIRIIVAVSLLFISTPLIGNTRTVDVTTLSDQDKIYHRIGWCRAIDAHFGTWGAGDKFKAFDNVLKNDGYFDNDVNDIVKKSFNDVDALFALDNLSEFMGKDLETYKEIVQSVFLVQDTVAEALMKRCVIDMKQIVKDTYVPNFSYMKN